MAVALNVQAQIKLGASAENSEVVANSRSTIPDDTPPLRRPTGKLALSAIPPEKAQPVLLRKLDRAPVIDGRLDEDVWADAAELRDFYRTEPGDNEEPSKPTVVRLAYDAKFLYIAFHCFDDPGKVRATVAKRDNVFNEDNVRVFLDTFNDQRRAYILGFNPYGVQQDGIYTEGTGNDFSVDIVMESKGIITSDGWTLEVAIPFKSLRYEAGQGKLWGFHAWRNIDRFNDEIDSWMPNDRNRQGLLNQAGHIGGLEGISTERTLEVIPSLTVSESGRRVQSLPVGSSSLTDPGRILNDPIRAEFGMTAKYSLTPTITLDFAYNPDFAQVEADQFVVAANQRFPIFFEEKRPFFLEGKDIFETVNQVVYTRTIVDPDVAAKISGKRGRNSFGALFASDNSPQNQSPTDRNAAVGVLRFKRDVGAQSNIGAFATSYNFAGTHNYLVGGDARLKLNSQSVLSIELVGSSSLKPFYSPQDDTTQLRSSNGFAYAVRYEVEKRNLVYNYDGRGRTHDYRADVGFTRRTNSNRHGFYVYWQTNPDPKKRLISFSVNSNPYISFDWQGRSQDGGANVETNFRLQRQTYVGFGYSRDYERVIEEEFGPKRGATRKGAFAGPSSERSTRSNTLYVFGGSAPTTKISGTFFVGTKRGIFDYDFGAGPKFQRVSPAALLDPDASLDPGPADTFDIELNSNLRPTNELNIDVGYTKARLFRHDTRRLAFDDNIYSLRGTYHFTRFLFARARVEYSTLTANARAQFLFGFNPNPGSALYLGYNDDLSRNGYSPFSGKLEPGFRRNNRVLFLKMSYLIRKSI